MTGYDSNFQALYGELRKHWDPARFSKLLDAAVSDEERAEAHYLWGKILAHRGVYQSALREMNDAYGWATKPETRGRILIALTNLHLEMGNEQSAFTTAVAARDTLKPLENTVHASLYRTAVRLATKTRWDALYPDPSLLRRIWRRITLFWSAPQ